MNAGEINIKVTASMEDFNRTMSAVKSTADTAGDIAGKGFSNGFKSQLSQVTDNFQSQMLSQVRKAFGAGAFINGLSTAIESAAQGANIATVFADSIKSLPFIGTLASSIETAISYATGAAQAEAELKASEERAARIERQLEEATAKRAAADDRIAARQAALAEVQLRRDIQGSLDASDKRAAADKEAQLEQMELQRRTTEAMRQAQYSFEWESIQALYLEEQKRIEENRVRKYRDIEASEKKIADDVAKRAKDEADKLAEKKRNDAEKLQKDLAEQESRLMQDRMAAQTAGIGSAQTALGSFKFDAYPASQKKSNDERIVKSLESIRDQQKTAGFI